MFHSMAGWTEQREINGGRVSDPFIQRVLVMHVQKATGLHSQLLREPPWVKSAVVANDRSGLLP